MWTQAHTLDNMYLSMLTPTVILDEAHVGLTTLYEIDSQNMISIWISSDKRVAQHFSFLWIKQYHVNYDFLCLLHLIYLNVHKEISTLKLPITFLTYMIASFQSEVVVVPNASLAEVVGKFMSSHSVGHTFHFNL